MMDEHKGIRQKLSMLLDAELDWRDNPRLLDRLESEEEFRAVWAHYHLIGQVIRSPGGLLADADFAARVSAMIRDEPTVLAPRQESRAVETAGRHKVATLAMAASLVAVAVLIGKSLTDHSGDFYASSMQSQVIAAADSKSAESVEKMAEAQFNDYLLVHNESAYLAGSAGMLPYVRLVSSGPDR
jgi:sigma-E factor negative regulatory protein RseA